MVHALEKVRNLLKPDGLLIDIHPVDTPTRVEVHVDDQITPTGWLKQKNDGEHYRQADAALADVIRRGLFTVQKAGQFIALYYADTIAALEAFLEREWTDVALDEATIQQTEELLAEREGHTEIILRENVHITRLIPVHSD